MGWLCFLFVLVLAVPAIVKQVTEAAKNKELADLKIKNPELWLQLKRVEHEAQMMEHQKHQLRHDKMKAGADIGGFILRLLLKK